MPATPGGLRLLQRQVNAMSDPELPAKIVDQDDSDDTVVMYCRHCGFEWPFDPDHTEEFQKARLMMLAHVCLPPHA
jgi:hypothetical protein